jgi:hypothetical protein
VVVVHWHAEEDSFGFDHCPTTPDDKRRCRINSFSKPILSFCCCQMFPLVSAGLSSKCRQKQTHLRSETFKPVEVLFSLTARVDVSLRNGNLAVCSD